MTEENNVATAEAGTGTETEAGVEAVDELGVPWKNRAKENERKLRIAQEQLNAMPSPKEQEQEQEQEDDWTTQQREIARQEYKKQIYAEQSVKKNLDNIELTNPYVRKYRNVIESRLEGLSNDLKTNLNSLTLIVNSVMGENMENIMRDNKLNLERQPAGNGRRLVENSSEVLMPTPNLNVPTTIELSEDEISYGEYHKLFDKGFTSSEVRDSYKKRQAKLQKQNDNK